MGKLNSTIIGWREWVELPDLGLPKINAKIDTGARTSSLHAFTIKQIGADIISFKVHPLQRDISKEYLCQARFIDFRSVKSSNGHIQKRYVIKAKMILGTIEKTIDITLSNRTDMGFRMLLGRQALSTLFLVNSGKSYLLNKTL